MNIKITEKEILETPNDQELGALVRKKYFELLKIKD
jgi:hypothetical protein